MRSAQRVITSLLRHTSFLNTRAWVATLGLCADVDFSEIDQFPKEAIRDLRNMREHQVEYFQGNGRDRARWFVETPEYKANASSLVGPMIGGRLDWVKFSEAIERLIPVLVAVPIPYIPIDVAMRDLVRRREEPGSSLNSRRKPSRHHS